MARKSSTAERIDSVPVVRVVGSVVMAPLASVRANPWNPNRLSPFMRESLKNGLITDGWLSSQSLLIWGTDEKGRVKNLIIDGEQRWSVAQECGFVEGPMVYLEKLPEAQAKALTIKMNQKRGEFDAKELGVLLREVEKELKVDNLSLDLGIEKDALNKLLQPPTLPKDNAPAMPTTSMKMVQLKFDAEQQETFAGYVKDLAAKYKTENITDTVFTAVSKQHALLIKGAKK